jgi:hypothetical protein
VPHENGQKKGAAPPRNSPDPNGPLPLKKGSDVIVQDCTARLYGQSEAKRGESGTRLQASPDPHRPHSPKLEIQGVR